MSNPVIRFLIQAGVVISTIGYFNGDSVTALKVGMFLVAAAVLIDYVLRFTNRAEKRKRAL